MEAFVAFARGGELQNGGHTQSMIFSKGEKPKNSISPTPSPFCFSPHIFISLTFTPAFPGPFSSP